MVSRFRTSAAGQHLEGSPIAVDAEPGNHLNGVWGDDRGVPELLGPLRSQEMCTSTNGAVSWPQASKIAQE